MNPRIRSTNKDAWPYGGGTFLSPAMSHTVDSHRKFGGQECPPSVIVNVIYNNTGEDML